MKSNTNNTTLNLLVDYTLKLIAFAVFFLMAYYDIKTGWKINFSALYIVPVVLALRFYGFAAGLVLTCMATAVRFSVSIENSNLSTGQVVWNVGMLLCTLLIVCIFIHRLEDLLTSETVFKVFDRTLMLSMVITLVVGVVGFMVFGAFSNRDAIRSQVNSASANSAPQNSR
jgi:hypothetical protein